MAHTEIVTRTNIIDAFRPVIMHYYFAMGRMDLSVFRELFTVTWIFDLMHVQVSIWAICYDFIWFSYLSNATMEKPTIQLHGTTKKTA